MAPLAYVRFREALDRLCVRLNMYLVIIIIIMQVNKSRQTRDIQ